MPYQSHYLTPSGELRRDLSEDEIKSAFTSKEGTLWIDINETSAEDGAFLERIFNFHPLAVQDCVDPAIHNPKVSDFNDHIFLTIRGINYTVESDILDTTELNLFLGPNFVVSNHNVFLYSVDATAKLVTTDTRLMERGAVFLAYTIMDALVENITPTIDRLIERVDDIEDEIFRDAHESTLEAITALKRSSLRLRRVMAPQREVFNQLGRRDFSPITEDTRLYFRDIQENVSRIEGFNENLRERADTAVSMYLSVVANRQNEMMKVLSIVAAIFLPLSLVAGIYGMNFENIPELKVSWGYFAVLGFMAAVIAITLWWFWARRWITTGRRRLKRFVPTAVDPLRLGGQLNRLAGRRRL